MKSHRQIRSMLVFAMLGALMFVGKQVFEAFPNFHPIGMLLMTFTVVYRTKALIPLYVFILIEGAYAGFNVWWYPYLYLWLPLWGMTMLLPRRLILWTPSGDGGGDEGKKTKARSAARRVLPLVLCSAVCSLHGLMYGTLYAPFQMLMFHYDLATTLKWIAVGFRWDLIHAAGNAVMGLLVPQLARVLAKLEQRGA